MSHCKYCTSQNCTGCEHEQEKKSEDTDLALAMGTRDPSMTAAKLASLPVSQQKVAYERTLKREGLGNT